MREKKIRILFLCAHRSVRALMAASLLAARVQRPWDIWSTGVTDARALCLAEQVLGELGIALMTAPQITEPSFGLTWHDGVVLCSSDAFT